MSWSQTLTVALSNTLMEKGSATLCFRRACSSSWRGGRSHFPNTTRSISLSTTKEIIKKSLNTDQQNQQTGSNTVRLEWTKRTDLVGRYSPVLKLPNIWTWKNTVTEIWKWRPTSAIFPSSSRTEHKYWLCINTNQYWYKSFHIFSSDETIKVHADSLQIEQYFDDLLGNGALSHSSGKFDKAPPQRQATINQQKKQGGGWCKL